MTDFGIAKVQESEIKVTSTGMAIGAPTYMSPEQATADAITGASDQYSLGIVPLGWADNARGSTAETEMEGVADEDGGFLLCGLPAEVPLAARVTAAGIEFRGTIKVNRVDYDEQGRPLRGGSLRAIRVVVTPTGRTP